MELVPIFKSRYVSPIPTSSHFKIYIPAPSLITILRPGEAMTAGVPQKVSSTGWSQQTKLELIVVSHELG